MNLKEICDDFNEVVMKAAFLTLFSRNSIRLDEIVVRLKRLTDHGLTMLREKSFNCLLEEFGDLFMDSFQVIRNEPKSDIFCCVKTIEASKTGWKNNHLFEFLINRVGNKEVPCKNH